MLDTYLDAVDDIVERLEKYDASRYTCKTVSKHLLPIKKAQARLRKGTDDVVVAWDQFTEIAKRLKYVYGETIPDIELPPVKNKGTLTVLSISETTRIREIVKRDLKDVFLINEKQALLGEFHKGSQADPLPVFIDRLHKLTRLPGGPDIDVVPLKSAAPTESLEEEQNLSRGYYFPKEDLGAEKAEKFLDLWDDVQSRIDFWCEVNKVDDTDVIKVYGESDLVKHDFEEMVKSRLEQLDTIYLTLIYRLV